MKIKNLINRALAPTGYHLSRNKISRMSLEGALQNIAKIWQPAIVVDVGAAQGSWTQKCREIFPAAKYFLLEPLDEFQPILKKLEAESKNTTVIPAAAAAAAGEISFNVHRDLYGSSIKKEVEGEQVNGLARKIKTVTLDQIALEHSFSGKNLLKMDVQGAELEVIAGAEKLLDSTECIILEVSLFKTYIGGAVFDETIARLKQSGFVAYDIFGALYRPYDNALSQVDMVFVKERGIFRQFEGYATPEQRKIQDEKFAKQLNKIMRR
jgi:FkbM family methyltransferase